MAMETSDGRNDGIQFPIFMRYGGTTVMPGELDLDIVLHVTNTSRTSRRGQDEPVLAARPMMGGGHRRGVLASIHKHPSEL